MKTVHVICVGQELKSQPLVDHLADEIVKGILKGFKNTVYESELLCYALEVDNATSSRKTSKRGKRAVKVR